MELSRTIRHVKTALAGLMVIVILFGRNAANLHSPSPKRIPRHRRKRPTLPSMAIWARSAKLANPLGSLWSLVMNFETPKFFDGNNSTVTPRSVPT